MLWPAASCPEGEECPDRALMGLEGESLIAGWFQPKIAETYKGNWRVNASDKVTPYCLDNQGVTTKRVMPTITITGASSLIIGATISLTLLAIY